jgi:DNA-binding transcriptional regulator YhcF (GntR family)
LIRRAKAPSRQQSDSHSLLDNQIGIVCVHVQPLTEYINMSNKYKTPTRKVRASAIEKSVLNILADHADDSGRSFPSVKTIALGTGFGETSVMTAVRQLEEEGLVRVEREHGEANRYYLNLAEIEGRAKSGRATRDDEERRRKRTRSKRIGCSVSATTSTAEADKEMTVSCARFEPPPIGAPKLWHALIAARSASVDDAGRWSQQASEYCDYPDDLNRALAVMVLLSARDLYRLQDMRGTQLVIRNDRGEKVLI